MKIRTLISILGVGMMFLCSGFAWADSPCPQLGHANGCNTVITLNAGGTASINVSSEKPYDGSEDNLVGVINNSGSAIGGITLSGSDIFGFDGDGAFSTACDNAGGAPYPCGAVTAGDSTGYAGPGTSFTVVDSDHGTVNFLGGLLNGGTIVFSLEEQPSIDSFTVTGTKPVGVPEPDNMILFGVGLVGISLLLRRRKKAASNSRA